MQKNEARRMQENRPKIMYRMRTAELNMPTQKLGLEVKTKNYMT